MQRINTPTAAQNLFGAGKHGFTDGDIVAGKPSTRLNAALFNALQEEVARAVEGAGLVLDPSSYTQLWQAIQKHTSDVIAAGIDAATLNGHDSAYFTPLVTFNAHVNNHSNPHQVTLGQLGGAPLNSPALTGAPTAPTPGPGTANTQLATTAFVQAAMQSVTPTLGMAVLGGGSGNWIVPAGVRAVKYRVWGAGGGGGGNGGPSTSGGSGGGAGGYAEGVAGVTPGQSLAYTVGAGGPGGANANGTAGGSTTLSTLGITCNGGPGGLRGVGTLAIAGVAGGSANGGQLNVPGGWSADGFYSGGGSAGVGGGAFGSTLSNGGGHFPGGGGNGSANSAGTAGATGANGLILFDWVA